MSTEIPVTVVHTRPIEKQALGGAQEGVERAARQMGTWQPPLRSADADTLTSKSLNDARSRDQARGEGYAQGALAIRKDSIVGGKYRLNARPNIKVLGKGATEAWAEEFQTTVEAKFNLYAESPLNWIDASRRNTFSAMMRLAVGTHLLYGEALATVEWVRDGIRPYNTAVQLIDPDRLSTPRGDNMFGDQKIRRGVERNALGAPVAYWIRDGYPADPFNSMIDTLQWTRVPTRKPWGRQQVIHVFEQFRPDQSRGVSDMVAVLKEMKMTARFQDIVLQNAVVNATYAATVESELPHDVVLQSLGGEDVGQTAIDFGANYLAAISAFADGSKNLNIDGIKIPHMFPGTKLQLRPAGQQGGVGTGFEESLLRHIAAALGLSYEQFSRDYSKSNYSSARASMNETFKFMQSLKKIIADKFATHVYWVWLEEAIWNNEVKLPVGMTEADFYTGQVREALGECTWLGASRGQIDELKETNAAVLKIRAGLSTYEEECGKLGYDFREVFAQRARENVLAESLDLNFDLSTKGAPPVDPNAEQNNATPGAGDAASGKPKPKSKPKAKANA